MVEFLPIPNHHSKLKYNLLELLVVLLLLHFLVLLTKADKLNRSEAARALSIVQLQAGGGQVQMFSALKRQGVEQAAQTLWHWIHPQIPAADPA